MATDVLKRIWPEWQIEGKPLGRGSFGVVYKAVRRDYNVESYAAIKVISIPADVSEITSLRSEGLDINATRTYLKGIVDDFVGEIQMMESLKGVQNIVSVEDYKVVEKTGEIGWDIYIRMELLTPFNDYILCDKKLTENEVIKLGCDICTALEICSKRNIIHRDIKPENIFINDFGHFKLGDFGIARKLENLTEGLSQKGTYHYMAPEVISGSVYDARADIYSLGLVLYRLLNGNRLPFLDTEKQLLNPNERKKATERRLRGEKMPAPYEASAGMADVILRACAFDPAARFASATEMKEALMRVDHGVYPLFAASNPDATISVRRGPNDDDKTEAVRKTPASALTSHQTVGTFDATPKKKRKVFAAIAAVSVAVIVVAGIFAVPKLFTGNDNQAPEETYENAVPDNTTITTDSVHEETAVSCTAVSLSDLDILLSSAGATWQLSATPSPADTTDKVFFASSDDTVVTVNETGLVTAVGSGRASIIVTCGEVVLDCPVVCEFESDMETSDDMNPSEDTAGDFVLKLKSKDFTLTKVGATYNLYEGEVDPADIIWTTDNKKIVTIDKGVVTAVGEGRTRVYGEYGDQKVSCWVSCKLPEAEETKPENDAAKPENDATKPEDTSTATEPTVTAKTYSMKVDGRVSPFGDECNAEVTITIGEEIRLTVEDGDGNRQSVTWQHSKEGICAVDGRTVTAIAKGKVILSATIGNQTFRCVIIVK